MVSYLMTMRYSSCLMQPWPDERGLYILAVLSDDEAPLTEEKENCDMFEIKKNASMQALVIGW